MTGNNQLYERDIRREFWPVGGALDESTFGSLDATICMPAGSSVKHEGRYYQGPIPNMTHRENLQ